MSAFCVTFLNGTEINFSFTRFCTWFLNLESTVLEERTARCVNVLKHLTKLGTAWFCSEKGDVFVWAMGQNLLKINYLKHVGYWISLKVSQLKHLNSNTHISKVPSWVSVGRRYILEQHKQALFKYMVSSLYGKSAVWFCHVFAIYLFRTDPFRCKEAAETSLNPSQHRFLNIALKTIPEETYRLF